MKLITNHESDDGFGSQYQRRIFSILYAENNNMEYVYRPFVKMAHNYDNDPKFIENKETFINLKPHYRNIDDVQNQPVYVLDPHVWDVNNNLDYYLQTPSFQKIKDLFYEGKMSSRSGCTNVAVHIRRPNADDIGDYGYHEDEYYMRAIEHIRDKYDGKKLFHIYSQGKVEDFNNFLSEDIILHLNESVEDTFWGMVSADILIMSKGSYSYAAALLSNGTVYYLPFWHSKSSKWLTIK